MAAQRPPSTISTGLGHVSRSLVFFRSLAGLFLTSSVRPGLVPSDGRRARFESTHSRKWWKIFFLLTICLLPLDLRYKPHYNIPQRTFSANPTFPLMLKRLRYSIRKLVPCICNSISTANVGSQKNWRGRLWCGVLRDVSRRKSSHEEPTDRSMCSQCEQLRTQRCQNCCCDFRAPLRIWTYF